jgi:hypothetical protein
MSILAMIVRESLVRIGAGEMAGLLGAFALTRFIPAFLFGVTPWLVATSAHRPQRRPATRGRNSAVACRRVQRFTPRAARS